MKLFKMSTPFICILTGAPGVGKSTLAELLSNTYARSARVEVDDLRHMIRGGIVSPFPETPEASKQLKLSVRNACALARNFVENGFSVFIDDIVETAERLSQYQNLLKGLPVYTFMLHCDGDTLARRDQGRSPEVQMGARSFELHQVFEKRLLEKNWYLINSTQLTPLETLLEIQTLLPPDIDH